MPPKIEGLAGLGEEAQQRQALQNVALGTAHPLRDLVLGQLEIQQPLVGQSLVTGGVRYANPVEWCSE